MKLRVRQLTRLARIRARAFFLVLPLLALAACNLLVGDSLVTPAGSGTYQVLPLRAFLTRPTIHADAMQFCRKDVCGYDAATGRITAFGADARALHDSLEDPAALAKLIAEPNPSRIIGGKSPTPAKVEVHPFEIDGWKGVRVSLTGGPKQRQAFGIAVEKPVPGGSTFLIVASSSSEVARRLAAAATGD